MAGPTRPSRTIQATVAAVDGRVFLERKGSTWTRVRVGEALLVGDRLRAGRSARAVIRYWDGVDVTLEGGTLVEVLDRAAPEDEALRLLLGEVLVDIRRGAGASQVTSATPPIPFRIRTPRAVAGAEGTRFRIRVGEQGSRVAVLEGHVQVSEAEGEGELTLGPDEAAAIGRRGRLRAKRPLALPWAATAAGLGRRERADEPFFGEVGRFRSQRFLGLVDPRRDALANPARLDRLLEGEGFEFAEVSVSGREGHTEPYEARDQAGTTHAGLRDRSEATDAADVFAYRALDDGRWGAALRLQRVNLRAREDLHAGAPAALAGGLFRREGSLEGAGVSGLVQRAWRAGRRQWGLELLHQSQLLDGSEAYASSLGGPVGLELAASDVDDRTSGVALGYSWDMGSTQDLGVVVRFQDRDVTRSEAARVRDGVPQVPGSTRLLDRHAWTLDALWRRRLSGARVLALRGYVEAADDTQREGIDFDPTRPRVEDEMVEDAVLYGLAVGMVWPRGHETLLAADLSWQRLDLGGHLVLPSGLRGAIEDERETRTTLHLGAMRRLGVWDVRGSLELTRVHRTEGFQAVPGAGVAAPRSEAENAWQGQLQVTLGRWLSSQRRVEFEFEEREPTRPERVLRIRFVKGF